MQHSHRHDDADGSHDHPAAPMVDEITDFEVLEIAVRELAIEKGLFTAEDHRRFTEWAESIGPAAGSRLVAKAWTDPAFKARVLADAVAACREIGVDWTEPTGSGTPSDYMHLVVLEDTPTLASRDRLHPVLVLPAAAARSLALLVPFAQLSSPAGPLAAQVLAEFGLLLPPEIEVRIEDSNQKCRFMVLPVRPAGTENWTEEQLAQIVTRDCMIGVALPRPDRKADDVRPVHKASRPVPGSIMRRRPADEWRKRSSRPLLPASVRRSLRRSRCSRPYETRIRHGKSSRRVTASPTLIRPGKSAFTRRASVSPPARLYLRWNGAAPRISSARPCTAGRRA